VITVLQNIFIQVNTAVIRHKMIFRKNKGHTHLVRVC